MRMKKTSQFVGTWEWENNNEQHCFGIWIGERNDSLLFAIGGIFYNGLKIHTPETEGDLYIPIVKILIPENNIAKSKICEELSSFYSYDRKEIYNDVSFELINDSTMQFILNDGKPFWPDTAILIKRKNENIKFSHTEDILIYKEK